MPAYSFDPEKTTPCKYCGRKTRSTGTKLCDKCWELKTRMEGDKERSIKIIFDIFPELNKEKN